MNSAAAGPSPDGLPPLREVIASLGLSARKALGQNFILDLNLTRRIARQAGPLEDTTVIEVGPGPGGLTRALLMEGASRVVAIERDERCRPALEAIAARYPGRLDIRIGDALSQDWSELTADKPSRPSIVANLPYNIATKLLLTWLETRTWPPWWRSMVLMFQKEVAERITAAPATKAYGRLSVIAQWRSMPRILMTLSPSAFTPPPEISSAVVEFIPRAAPRSTCSSVTLSRVTAAAFGQRRKMLRQSLKALLREPEPLLVAAGIVPELRAEQLTVNDFERLACVFEAQSQAKP